MRMTTTHRHHVITLELPEPDEEIGVTQRLVQRPARLPPPELPLDPMVLLAPPAAVDSQGGLGGIAQVALPLMGRIFDMTRV